MLKNLNKKLKNIRFFACKNIKIFSTVCKSIAYKIKIFTVKYFNKSKIKSAWSKLLDRVKCLLLKIHCKIENMKFKRAIAGVLFFSILIGITAYIPNTKISALELKYEGSVIGYAKSKTKVNQAKEKVIENTGCGDSYIESVFDKKIKTEIVTVSETQIDSVRNLSENIVDTVNELSKGYGIYLDGELYFSFERRSDAEFVLACLNNQIKSDYKVSDYEIINNLEVQEGNYIKENMITFADVSLEFIYKNIKVQSYKHFQKTKKLKYDVVYVVNDKLAFGESKVLSKGTNGKYKYYYKVTYLNGKKKSREIIKTDILKEPKARTIEISQEEYNILMADKTIKDKDYSFPLNSNEYYVSSLYGYRWGKVHGGIDLAVKSNTGVRAYKAGKVTVAEYNSSYGNYIVVEHKNGLKTLYAHCNSLLADVGSKVKKGQIIALSGNTGNSTGPHLHFEVYVNGNRINPAKYIGIYADESKDSKRVNDLIKTVNLSGSKLNFINSIKDAAIEGYQHYNILPSLTLAQAVIESAWGKSAIGNNIFGIKAYFDWKGNKKCVWTSEERKNGTKYRTKAWFKDYDSITESVYDHTKLLLGSRYNKVREAANYREACYAVKAAGYATSSDYAETLINVIETYGLYAWDNVNYKLEKINAEDEVKESEKTKEKASKDKDKTSKPAKKKTKSKNKQTKNENKSTAKKTSVTTNTEKQTATIKITTVTTPVQSQTEVQKSTISEEITIAESSSMGSQQNILD